MAKAMSAKYPTYSRGEYTRSGEAHSSNMSQTQVLEGIRKRCCRKCKGSASWSAALHGPILIAEWARERGRIDHIS